MISTVTNPSLYSLFRTSELTGVNGRYVDDLLSSGNNQFKSILSRTLERLETNGNDELCTTIAGIHIEYFPDRTYIIDQLSCVDKLTQLRKMLHSKNFLL